MKAVNFVLFIFATSIVAIAVLAGTMRAGLWSPSYAAVKAKYAGAPSQFIDVDGNAIHMRDEGQGPVLVMLHSSMTNLREWDAWADKLKKNYRVIRLDWPPYGLSINPNGKYSMADAELLLEHFVDKLKLEKFTLVGTSSGATICVLYAARNPERIDALALSTLPLAAPPPTKVDWRVSAIGWAHRNFFPNYYPEFYYGLTLSGLFADPAKVTPEIVDWYYETNNIPGAQEHIASYIQADVKSIWKNTGHGDAEKVTAPVLLQWGDADPVLPAALGDDARARLANAPVTLIHYQDAGHYPMLEIPDKTVADLEKFLGRIYPKKD